jgi:hypothetical protein
MTDFNQQGIAKRLLGKPARLAVARWVIGQPSNRWFALDEVDRQLPDTQKSEVLQCLLLFVELDMLERVAAVPNRPQYRRRGSPLWSGFGAFAKALDALAAASEARGVTLKRSRSVVDMPRRKEARPPSAACRR